MPGKYCDSSTKALAMSMLARGMSTYKIGAQLRIHPTTVTRICERVKKTRSVYSTKPKTGRPRKLTPSDVQFAALSIARTRNYTATALQREFFPGFIPLRSAGLCVAWAYGNIYGIRFLSLAPETNAFVLPGLRSGSLGQGWCGVGSPFQTKASSTFSVRMGSSMSGEGLDPLNTKKFVKHGGGSIMVWGVITAAGVGRLYRIEGTLTGARYTEILQDAYLGTLKDQRRRPQSIIFQQDNDPKHTSLVAREWFQSRQIEVTPWPASSPDLNIIEHVWEFLDRKVRSRDVLPRNKAELWEALKEEWYRIPLSFIEKLYDSIPSRLQAVIDAKGGNTRY
ncbi:DDE superfamily endonuclease [Ceratobasidium sp. AG-Ba]|nr:DDE superfamily endonuclease [Ceratobasidium sp. AG-Ba]